MPKIANFQKQGNLWFFNKILAIKFCYEFINFAMKMNSLKKAQSKFVKVSDFTENSDFVTLNKSLSI